MTPTLAGFLAFVRSQMGVPASALPDDSQFLTWAYDVAVELVNQNLQGASPTIYLLAVYNCAASNLLAFAQDVPPLAAGAPGYFAAIRKGFNMNAFTLPVSSASDEGTSTSYVVPEFLSTLSLADLGYLTNPYGRQYLAFAQRYGTVWGLS